MGMATIYYKVINDSMEWETKAVIIEENSEIINSKEIILVVIRSHYSKEMENFSIKNENSPQHTKKII